MTTTLIIPGLYSSGPGHWQTWFEEQLPGTLRVIQSDWKKPDLAEWSRRVRRDISRNPGRHIIVAHSFGVLAGIHAASGLADRIDGALLVAPADPDKFGIAASLPQQPLPFPAVVVASSNDPWMDLWTAAGWADRWCADFVNLGDAGHINAESGFGAWPEGLAMLDRLRQRTQSRWQLRGAQFKQSHAPPAAWKSETWHTQASGVPGRQSARRLMAAANRLGVG